MLARLLCLLVALAPLSFAAAADYIQHRSGLARSHARFVSSQQDQAYTKITYFGGSITQGAGASKPDKCYRALTHQNLRALYPGANLAENNSAIGGTGSWLGAFRTKLHALYGGAALVLVEFAVNDGGAPEEQTLAAMEGIVRQIWRADSRTDIVFVYTVAKNGLAEYAQGQLPKAVQYHEKVAAHYGIPSVNVGMVAAEKIRAGELTAEEWAQDGVHPTDRGYQIYADALKAYFTEAKALADQAAPTPHKMPTPLTAAPMEKAQCVPYEWATLTGPWRKGQPSPTESFMHVLEANSPEATLSLRFKGSQFGLFDLIGPQTTNLEISVDGGPWQPKVNWDRFAKEYQRPHSAPLLKGLDPSAWHEVKVRPSATPPEGGTGQFVRIGYLLVDGEVEDPLAKLDPLSKLDAIWQDLGKPLNVELAPNRFANIPKTMQRLREGGPLRIVLLGDSIMGDTYSSQYQLLLSRLYPQAQITSILSNRGSTGCWYYKDDNRVESYVFKHQPDLLMIGGISQRGDTEAIRSVIQQVRAKLPDCEYLLLSPAFGATQDPHIKNWQYHVDHDGNDYRTRLQNLATQEKTAFFDMTGPWWQYIKDSGMDYGYFRRDKVHANDRGKQILGRLLEAYFHP